MAKRKTKVVTQKQKQTVSQNVVIQLAEKVAKKKRRRAKKKTAPTDGADSLYLQGRQPPNVVYQYTNSVPQEPYSTPIPVRQAMKIKDKTPFLEDVGTVGTEGAVEILDLPSKKETLSELETPVPSAFKLPPKARAIADLPPQFTAPSPFQQTPLASSQKLFGMGPEYFEMSNPMLNEEYGLVSRTKKVKVKLDPRDKLDTRANLLERYTFLNAPPTNKIKKMKIADLKALVQKMETL